MKKFKNFRIYGSFYDRISLNYLYTIIIHHFKQGYNRNITKEELSVATLLYFKKLKHHQDAPLFYKLGNKLKIPFIDQNYNNLINEIPKYLTVDETHDEIILNIIDTIYKEGYQTILTKIFEENTHLGLTFFINEIN